MKATKTVTSIATLIMVAALVAPAFAQEPTQPNLLLELTRPSQPVPIDSITRDDLRDRPVGVGDPRCFPGEDGFGPGRIGGGPRRRSR